MISKLMSLLAIVFPWLVLFIYDNPGGAIVALVLQATIIGWPLAIILAWRTVHEKDGIKKNQKPKEKTEKAK